ncbi:diguanylate cyclase [Lysinibacillus sp. KU-BSD001]|uniref:diguanylate cyclase domain-containing protein n=1 Tax=Lysinibacillus sp. KU-BSD001 TaxID=3141328 RepID=UPI0036ED7133
MRKVILDRQLESYLISLFECNTDGILLLNKGGYIVDANLAFLTLGGYTKEELLNRNFLEIIVNEPPDNSNHLSFTEIDFTDARFRLITKANTQIGCLMRLNQVIEHEKVIGFFLTVKNMSELDKIAERYLESEFNYRKIAENIQDVLILMDQHQNYLYVSPSSKEMFGFDYTTFEHQEVGFYIHPDDVEEFTNKFHATIEKRKPFALKIQMRHQKLMWIWTEIKGKAVYDMNGHFLHVLLVIRDISRERQQEETLKYLAYHDPLTNLPNRRMFREHLTRAFTRLNEQHISFAVLLLDIDNFKQINDSYGHEIGDQVIIEYGARLQQTIGKKGLVARLGGDEFVILLTDFIDEEQVSNIAYRINERVRQGLFIQQTYLEITTSIGVAICDNSTFTASQILRYADKALYNIKEHGKDAFSIYKVGQ